MAHFQSLETKAKNQCEDPMNSQYNGGVSRSWVVWWLTALTFVVMSLELCRQAVAKDNGKGRLNTTDVDNIRTLFIGQRRCMHVLAP